MANHGPWVGNLGYCAFATETTPGTAVTPTVFTLLDNETMTTNYNLEDQMPIAGIPFETYQVTAGLRGHKGDIEIIAEPDTATELFDAFASRGTITGSGPYTYPYTISGTSVPNSKTMDISTGNVIKRFVGVQASKLSPTYSKNQIMIKASLSALGSFQGGVILSVSGAGPYTINFDPTYDTNPTSKLVVGDLLSFYHPGTAATTSAVVATIPTALSITVVASVGSYVAGDIVYLRPQTPSFTLLNPFLWSNTQFCFGATASAALSAAQTRVESGSTWELDYMFENDSGSPRSGNADPAALIRTVATSSLTIKKFFDTPDDIINFNQLNQTACVIRHFAYAGAGEATAYEMRISLNHLITDDPLPKIKAKDVNYENIKYKTQYDTGTGTEFTMTMINGLSTLG
jgi:hypothetical protein